MRTFTNLTASLFLAASPALVAAACGGNSSSSNDSSSSAATTGGAGGSGADNGTSTGGTNSTSTTTTTGATNAGNTVAGDAGGSGGTASTAGGAGGGTDTTVGGAGGTAGAGGTTGGSAGEGTGGAGGSSGDGGTAGSGGTGPTGEVGVLGEPCDSPGQLACAGNHQKLTLVCGGDSEWAVNQTCSADQFCDSQAAPTAGTCQPPAPGCTGLEPGARFCDAATVVECGVDTVTSSEIEQCDGACVEGVCDDTKDACPEGEFVDCAGDCGGVGQECLDTCPPLNIFPGTSSWTIRVPAYGDLCGAPCDSSVRGVKVLLGTDLGQRVRVTVASPWRLALGGDNADVQCESSPADGCLIAELTTDVDSVHILTTTADAGPRNALFELVEEEAVCP